MVRIIDTLKTMAFWGIASLLILIFGFKINIHVIISTALSGIKYVNAVCIYYLVSIVVFPLSLVLLIRLLPGFSAVEQLSDDFKDVMTAPFKGFNLTELFELKDMGLDKSAVLYEIYILFYRLMYTLLWWAFTLLCWYEIIKSSNPIKEGILVHTPKQIAIIIGGVFAVYILLLNLSKGISIILWKKWRDYQVRLDYAIQASKGGTKRQKYYEKHPGKVPSACRACGGPYPECKSSCKLYN